MRRERSSLGSPQKSLVRELGEARMASLWSAASKTLQFLRLLGQRRLSSAELRMLQERKLRSLLRHAYEHVPYYRSLFQQAGLVPEDIRTLEDLPKIPVSRKEDLRAAGLPNTVAQGTDLSRCAVLHTSGTTGKPYKVYMNRSEATLRKMLQFRAVWAVGFRPWERLAILGPCAQPPSRLRFRLGLYRTDGIPGTLPVSDQLALLQKLRPDLLWIYPSTLRPVLHKVNDELHNYICPRVLISSSEAFPPWLRERVQKDLGVEIFSFYGTMEVGRVAVECAAHEGLHVEADQVLLECLAEGHTSVLDTPGEVVVTALDSYSMPFIRYHLGDTCRLLSRPCSCGSAFPLIAALQGRVCDVLQLPSGDLRSADALMFFLKRFAGGEQVLAIQERPDRLVVMLVAVPPPPQEALEQLHTDLVTSLGEPVDVVIELVDRIPPQLRGRSGGFVSRLAPPDA